MCQWRSGPFKHNPFYLSSYRQDYYITTYSYQTDYSRRSSVIAEQLYLCIIYTAMYK